MARRIIVLATNGDSREDGNVNYCDYLIVESNNLTFNEHIFTDTAVKTDMSVEDIIWRIKSYGYTVEQPDCAILWYEE